jgi:2-methylisocitrate lyase-like PEP mutase family enzyme
MANMVEGGRTPLMTADELEKLGYSMVIFPGGAVRAMAATAQRYYTSLLATGSNAAMGEAMFSFDGLNQVIGTDDMLAQGNTYNPEAN